jgi:hypothetical protein
MKLLLVGLLLILSVSSANAQSRVDTILNSGIIVLHSIDTAETMYMLGKYPELFREANPILRELQDRPTLFAITKAGMALGSNIAINRMTRNRPKTRWAIKVAQVGLMSWVVIHNSRIKREALN